MVQTYADALLDSRADDDEAGLNADSAASQEALANLILAQGELHPNKKARTAKGKERAAGTTSRPLSRLNEADPAPGSRVASLLKEAFTTAPTLVHFDPSRKIRLETDSSGFGIAGSLSQFLEAT